MRLSRPLDQFIVSGGQLPLVLAVVIVDPPSWRAGLLALMAALSLSGWLLALRRRRLIQDTPTARIATAAQGFVEIVGSGRPFPENPVRSPLTGLPCLWYRFSTEERTSDHKWERVASGESHVSIVVDDGSGEALVDPERAEILTRHRERWTDGDRRHSEWKLIAGDRIHVLGELQTVSGATLSLDADADTGRLLADWKREPATLGERFDLDGDGAIDAREWQLARVAARREIVRRHAEARAAADVHLIRAPRDGRPFLITNHDPDRLARRFGAWSLLHAATFVAAMAAIPQVLAPG